MMRSGYPCAAFLDLHRDAILPARGARAIFLLPGSRGAQARRSKAP
jgi:hypothetical protein